MNSIRHVTSQLLGSPMMLAMVMWLVPAAPTLRLHAANATGIGAQHHRGRDPYPEQRTVETNRAPGRAASGDRTGGPANASVMKTWRNRRWAANGRPSQEGERQEFVDLFVQLVRDSFAGKIDAYADERVLYLSEQRYDRIAEVRTKLVRPQDGHPA